MSDETGDKVVAIGGGAVHFSHAASGQLFTPETVLEGLPMDELDELVVIGRTRKGEVYLGSTHSTSVISLLLGQAADYVHRAYKPYGSGGGG